jgi:hypothetical protein
LALEGWLQDVFASNYANRGDNRMDQKSQSIQKTYDKKSYVSPRLVVYGDLGKITAGGKGSNQTEAPGNTKFG